MGQQECQPYDSIIQYYLLSYDTPQRQYSGPNVPQCHSTDHRSIEPWSVTAKKVYD